MGRCKTCKRLAREEPFIIPGKPNRVSRRWAWHWQDTHGILMEFLPEFLAEAYHEAPENWWKWRWVEGTTFEPPRETVIGSHEVSKLSVTEE